MANPLFDLIKAAAKLATGTTVGKVTTTVFVITVSGTAYKFYKDERTGNIVGAEVVERTVAKNDAQGDVRVKMEGLKDAPKDADAEKAAAEAAARAAEEAAKAKEAETAKLEEALKAQKEAEEAAALAEQQAQEQNGENFADEEQNPDDLKDENADEGNGEGDTENEADDDEKGPDTYRGGNDDDDGKTDESGNPIETGNNDENNVTEKTGNNDENNVTEKTENNDENNVTEKTENNDENNVTEKTENNDENNVTEKTENNDEKKETQKTGNNDEKKETQKTGNNTENNEEGQGEEFQEEDGTDEKKNNDGKKETQKTENNNNNNGTPTKVKNNNSNNNVKNTVTSGRHVENSLNHNDFGTTKPRVSPMEVLRQAIRQPRMILESELEAAGDFEEVVAKVVYEAAKSGVKEVGFDTKRVEKVLGGIRSGFSRIASEEIYPEYEVFSVRLSFPVKYLKGFESSCSELSKYEVSVTSDEYGSSRIDLKRKTEQQTVTPEDDNRKAEDNDWKAVRHEFVKRFSNEWVQVNTSDYIERAGTSSDPALTWLVRTAGWGGKDPKNNEFVWSAVRRLTISLEPKAEQREEMIRDISYGVNELLQEKGLELKNGFLKINVSFADWNDWVNENGFPKKISYYNGKDNRFEVKYLKNGDLLLYSKDLLRRIVGDRFKNGGNNHVWEEEVDILGLEDVLCLAAKPESKVKELYLRTINGNENFFVKGHDDVREQLEKALKEICAMEKINTELKINTNFLDEKEAEDLQLKVNFDYTEGDFRDGWQAYIRDGVVSFKRNQKLVVSQEIRDNFKDSYNMDTLEKYFQKHSGTISWDELVTDDNPDAGKWYDTTVPSYREGFRAAARELKAYVIPVAAKFKSKCTKLELGEALFGWVALKLKEVLRQSEAIHEFDLQVDNAQKIYDVVMKDKTSEWKHKLEIHDGVLRIVNGVEVNGSGTETTPTSTGGTGGAGDEMGIVPAAKGDGNVSELEMKSYSDENALISEILNVLEMPNEIHEFALKCNGINDAFFDKVTAHVRYARRRHNLCKFKYDGTDESGKKVEKTGLYFMNGIYGNPGKTDAVKLEALRQKLGTVGKDLSCTFAGTGFTLPTIFPYDSCNDPKSGYEGVVDSWIITDVLNYDECPADVQAELAKDKGKDSDLILEATCFYYPNLYADGKAEAAGFTGTRNYFLHSWLADDLNQLGGRRGHGVDINLLAKTKIINANGIVGVLEFDADEKVRRNDFDDRNHSVNFHGGYYYSPNNFIFQIKHDNADAWFVSSHTSQGGTTRRIAIHWTFIEDNDSGKYGMETPKRYANELRILPCQFSLNPDERSMDAVKVYLKWKEEKKKEKEKEEVLQKLEEAARDGNPFLLTEAKNKSVSLEEILGKANEINNAQLSLNGLTPDDCKITFDDLEKAFAKCFVEGKFDPKSNWSIFADLNDPDIEDYARVFRDKVNEIFAKNDVTDIFVNVDKVNGKVFFSDKDECGKETKLPSLKLDGGKLKWTVDLKRWWRNPANKVETFAVALAETPGLTEVDFAEIDDCAGLFGYNTDEWKAFRDDEVLHRYRKNDAAKAFCGCSGVKFTFVPEENDADLLGTLITFFLDANALDVAKPTWSVTVEDKCRFVEDSGKYRFLWNNRAMELLEDAKSAKGEGARKDALEKFANEVGDAKTGASHTFVDFTVKSGDADFDILREACERKELWDALKVKFGNDDSCTFICPKEIGDVKIGGMNLPGFLRREGWQVVFRDVGDVWNVTGKKDDGAPKDEEEDLGLGGLFDEPGAAAGEPPMPDTIPWAVAGLVTVDGNPKMLRLEEHSKYLYLHSTLEEFISAVHKKLPDVREMGWKFGAKADLDVLLKFKGWVFKVGTTSTLCRPADVFAARGDGKVRIDDSSINGVRDDYIIFTVL